MKSASLVLVAWLICTGPVLAAGPVAALVEDVSGGSAGVEAMDYVEAGKVIRLGPQELDGAELSLFVCTREDRGWGYHHRPRTERGAIRKSGAEFSDLRYWTHTADRGNRELRAPGWCFALSIEDKISRKAASSCICRASSAGQVGAWVSFDHCDKPENAWDWCDQRARSKRTSRPTMGALPGLADGSILNVMLCPPTVARYTPPAESAIPAAAKS